MDKGNESVYREAFDGILQIYLFKVKQQEQREHQYNILLVLAGVLSVVLFNCYTDNTGGTKPWWITAIPLIGVYIISIYHVFPKKNLKPWISQPDYDKIVTGEKPVSEMYKELNKTMYFLIPTERDDVDTLDRKYITCAICLTVAVFASLSINLLWSTLLEIYSITTVIFIVLGISFYYAFIQSEKKMIETRDAINKKIEAYMKIEKNGVSEKMKTDRELLEEILGKVTRIEKKSMGRFIMSMGFVLFAAAIALWGWGLKTQPIDMLYFISGFGIYFIGLMILLYGIYKGSK